MKVVWTGRRKGRLQWGEREREGGLEGSEEDGSVVGGCGGGLGGREKRGGDKAGCLVSLIVI